MATIIRIDQQNVKYIFVKNNKHHFSLIIDNFSFSMHFTYKRTSGKKTQGMVDIHVYAYVYEYTIVFRCLKLFIYLFVCLFVYLFYVFVRYSHQGKYFYS